MRNKVNQEFKKIIYLLEVDKCNYDIMRREVDLRIEKIFIIARGTELSKNHIQWFIHPYQYKTLHNKKNKKIIFSPQQT